MYHAPRAGRRRRDTPSIGGRAPSVIARAAPGRGEPVSPAVGERPTERLTPAGGGRGGTLARRGEDLERVAARGDVQFPQQTLHVRANGVLRDEEPLRDLVGAEVFVEQQEHLELARGENLRDRV